MSEYHDIDELCARLKRDIRQRAETIGREIKELMDYETQREYDNAIREFGEYQREEIKNIFDKAVGEFYSSYSPAIYSRQYGLYDLLAIPSGDGIVDYSTIDDIIDPSNLHSDRSGGSLYEKVFEQGWHGGAESGPKHPSPGTPRYRKPPPRYPRWGRVAARSDPPDERFDRDLANAEAGYMNVEYERIVGEHNEIAMDRVQKQIDSILKKYNG